ncbi:MAG: DNA-processing protein DprA [Balneolales bacterium]|nr:DNA-processing protein DprA [Balneolales bacterium]
MKRDELRFHIALSLVNGLGANRINKLLDTYGNVEEIFKAGKHVLTQVEGIGEKTAENIVEFSSWNRVDELIRKIENTDVWMLTLDDPNYPPRLKHIYDPPHLLWGLGSVESLSIPSVAVIGTRKPSAYGIDKARFFSKELASIGLGIVSGLAYGIDTIAHQSAVDAGGITVAVLGSGIDRIYPSANRMLVSKILDSGGAVISEFVPGTKPDRENFPVRNRIVSGLSRGVLVVESDVTGGSMITAYAALDQNREVFAIPHDINRAEAKGGNVLIRKGHAKLCIHPGDVIEELQLPDSFFGLLNKPLNKKENAGGNSQQQLFGIDPSVGYKQKKTQEDVVAEKQSVKKWQKKNINERLTDTQKSICSLINDSPTHIDDIAEKLEIPVHILTVQLLELELEGCVKALNGKRFISE